jgi:hypothetical protein
MTRLVIVALVIAAAAGCKHKKASTTTKGDPVIARRLSIGWGFQPAETEMTDVFLATTDETGKQVSTSIGRYKGTCTTITPAKEMNALTGASCTTSGGGGTELHAVVRPDEIIIMQLGVTPGATPDPMAREQVTSIKIPLGISVEAAK